MMELMWVVLQVHYVTTSFLVATNHLYFRSLPQLRRHFRATRSQLYFVLSVSSNSFRNSGETWLHLQSMRISPIPWHQVLKIFANGMRRRMTQMCTLCALVVEFSPFMVSPLIFYYSPWSECQSCLCTEQMDFILLQGCYVFTQESGKCQVTLVSTSQMSLIYIIYSLISTPMQILCLLQPMNLCHCLVRSHSG